MNELYEKADNSIQLVEQQLTLIANLANNHDKLAIKLAELKQSEASVLETPAGKGRVEKVLKLRAEIDCAAADATRAKAELAVAKDALFPLAASANNDLHAFRDQLVADRKIEVRKLLLQVFEPKAADLMAAYINYSIPIKALEMDRLIFIRDRSDHNVAAAYKLRSQLSFLITGKLPEPSFVESPVKVAKPQEATVNSLGSLL